MTRNEQNALSVLEEVSRDLTDACHSLCALCGLLDRLEATFSFTLTAAREEAGSHSEIEGSYWWMQNHYDEVGTAILAANVLSGYLARQLDGIGGKALPVIESIEREKSRASKIGPLGAQGTHPA